MLVAAGLFAFGLFGQLFFVHMLPVGADGAPVRDPFESLSPIVYGIEVVYLLLLATVAVLRMRVARGAVPASLVCAILLLPSCPLNVVAVIWLFKEYRRERDWVRGGR